MSTNQGWESQLFSQMTFDQQRVDRLRQSLSYGVTQNPDQYAKQMSLARATGVPPEVQQGSQDEVEQAARLADIGIAFERAQRHKVPLSLGLGQHPDPDGTFSFYGATPSGFDFEIGAGTHDIDPRGWQVQHTQVTSSWGHKPQLRMQLNMARHLLARKLFATRKPRAAMQEQRA